MPKVKNKTPSTNIDTTSNSIVHIIVKLIK